MKNSIAFKLAKASVLKEKKNYIISFVMMLIAFMFTFIFSGYLTLTNQSDLIQRKMNYGGWSVCYENQNEVTKEFFSNSKAIDSIATLEVSNILGNGNYVANYSSEYFKMNYITLLEGEVPSSSNEILVLKNSGKAIGDYVDVEYVYPVTGKESYKVVGIINDYNQLWSIPSADYFVYNHDVYKDYTYLSSLLPIDSLLGVDDCIYNFSLLSRDAYLEVCKVNGYYPHHELTLGKGTDNTVMNTFIIVVSMGLFISVFYNINQREKNVFLLRCIGMSKKNMNKYIFFEVIIITIIALVISLIVGSISLLALSIIVYNDIGTFLFIEAFKISISYIALLLVIIVCFVYLSILPIAIHSMDSLIHKKERKVMKKYHKAKYMSISRLSDKISRRYGHYIFSLSLLILVEAICISSMLSYRGYFNQDESKESRSRYHYYLNYRDDEFMDKMFSVIDKQMSIRYTQADITGWGYTYFCDLEGLEGRLMEGRLPQNKDECLLYQSDIYSPRYKMGDSVVIITRSEDVYNEEEDSFSIIPVETREMKIVGTIDLSDYDSLDGNYYYDFPSDWIMFATLDNAFSKDLWKDVTYIETNKNIFFQLNELSNKYNPYYSEVSNINRKMDYNNLIMQVEILNRNNDTFVTDQILIYVPTFVIANLFVIFMVRLLVDRLNKDFKLTRCLGMTFKQTMLSYVYIGISIILYPMLHYFNIFNTKYIVMKNHGLLDKVDPYILCEPLIVIGVVCLVNIVGFMLYAYKKTNTTVTFYPTDVERYY